MRSLKIKYTPNPEKSNIENQKSHKALNFGAILLVIQSILGIGVGLTFSKFAVFFFFGGFILISLLDGIAKILDKHHKTIHISIEYIIYTLTGTSFGLVVAGILGFVALLFS